MENSKSLNDLLLASQNSSRSCLKISIESLINNLIFLLSSSISPYTDYIN